MSKVVVITGASSGIGATLAQQLAVAGHKVVLVARREAELNAIAEQCGGNAFAVVADVTSRDQVRGIVDKSIAHFGRIDVWVNNAGRGMSRMPSQITDADIDEMMLVNVKSVVYCMQEVLPHFKQRGDGQIINVSSMLGRLPLAPIRAAYAAAKHYLNGLTALLREELKAEYPGICISLVSPGVVATEFGVNAAYGGPDSRTIPNAQNVDEVAAVIANVIETRAIDAYTFPAAKQMVLGYFSNLN